MYETDRPYRLALVLGRFQTFHLGHEMIVKRALDVSKKVILLIGSSQESKTSKNPFSYEERNSFISLIFKKEVEEGRLVIRPLPDAGFGNVNKWGAYVLDNCRKHMDDIPDIMVSGKEDRRTSWFKESLNIDEMYVSKSIDISASTLREYIILNDFDNWKRFVNPKLYDSFEMMKKTIIDSKDNNYSESI